MMCREWVERLSNHEVASNNATFIPEAWTGHIWQFLRHFCVDRINFTFRNVKSCEVTITDWPTNAWIPFTQQTNKIYLS